MTIRGQREGDQKRNGERGSHDDADSKGKMGFRGDNECGKERERTKRRGKGVCVSVSESEGKETEKVGVRKVGKSLLVFEPALYTQR